MRSYFFTKPDIAYGITSCFHGNQDAYFKQIIFEKLWTGDVTPGHNAQPKKLVNT